MKMTPAVLESILSHVERTPSDDNRKESIKLLREHIAAQEAEIRACRAYEESLKTVIDQQRAEIDALKKSLALEVAAVGRARDDVERLMVERDAANDHARIQHDRVEGLEEDRIRIQNLLSEMIEARTCAEAESLALAERLEDALSDKQAARQEKDSLTIAYVNVLRERDEAVADNAALLKVRRLVDVLASSERKPRHEREKLWRDIFWACHVADAQPHPGVALLEQHRKELAEARNKALEEAARECIAKRDSLRPGSGAGTRRGGLEEAASIARCLKTEPTK